MPNLDLNLIDKIGREPIWFVEDVLGDKLTKEQGEILESIRDNPRTAVRSAHAVGKALPLTTLLPTPDGWMTMEQVKIGDLLLNENGLPTKVIAVSNVEKRQCSKITFSDGTEIVASDDHLWSVLDLRNRPRRRVLNDWRDFWDETFVKTTRDLKKELRAGKQSRWRIPITKALEGKNSWPLPWSPYLVGAWLGNGTTIRAELTVHSDDIEHYAKILPNARIKKHADRNAALIIFEQKTYVDNPGRKLGGKRISSFLLRTSIEDRWELLRGLMDTDGYMSIGGMVEITLCDEKLVGDVHELIVSLGMQVRRSSGHAKIDGRIVGTRYRLLFRPSKNPFLLERKALKWAKVGLNKQKQSKHTIRTITAIHSVGVKTVKCVTVDSERSLYLAGRSMIPTHNSFTSARAALWFLYGHWNSIVVTTAPTDRQVTNIIWREIRRAHARAKIPLGGDITTKKLDLSESWYGFGFSTDNADSVQGIHSETGYILVIGDEAAGIEEHLFEGIEGLLTSPYARLALIGNPTVSSGYFYKECMHSPNTKKFKITAHQSPNVVHQKIVIPGLVDQSWIDDKARRWGVTSPLYRSRVDAEFPDLGDDNLIPLSVLEKAKQRGLDAAIDNSFLEASQITRDFDRQEDIVEMGVDVARFGSDESVFSLRRNFRFRILERSSKQSTMETAGKTKQYIKLYKPKKAKIDDVGLGGGVVDRLKEQEDVRACIKPINVGQGPISEKAEDFLNRRAEIYWLFREMLHNEPVAFEGKSEDVDDLISQLSSIKYRMLSNGKIQLESKQEMKERGVSSPDLADSIVLCSASTKNAKSSRVGVLRPKSSKVARAGRGRGEKTKKTMTRRERLRSYRS